MKHGRQDLELREENGISFMTLNDTRGFGGHTMCFQASTSDSPSSIASLSVSFSTYSIYSHVALISSAYKEVRKSAAPGCTASSHTSGARGTPRAKAL